MIKYSLFLILLVSITTTMSYAQYGSLKDNQTLQNEFDKLQQQIANENQEQKNFQTIIQNQLNNQNQTLNEIKQNNDLIKTRVDSIDQAQSDTVNSVWISSNLGLVVAITLAILSTIVSISIALKDERRRRKYYLSWLAAGIVIGALLAIILLNLRSLFP